MREREKKTEKILKIIVIEVGRCSMPFSPVPPPRKNKKKNFVIYLKFEHSTRSSVLKGIKRKEREIFGERKNKRKKKSGKKVNVECAS